MKWMLIAIAALALAVPAFVVSAEDEPQKDEKKEEKKEEPKEPKKEETELPEDSLYRLKTKTLDGKDADLSAYKGKVALVVNVASKWGHTPQYSGLEKLYGELKDKNFVVIGIPSNDFGKQEPGTAKEIRDFCDTNYKVTFPLLEKQQTKDGEGQSAIYANLKKQANELPSWNFCKYLVGKDGKVIKFYASKVKPDDKDLRKAIDEALAVK